MRMKSGIIFKNLLGISGRYSKHVHKLAKHKGNQLSVRLELQADCFVGIWAHQNQQRTQFLEQGDIEEQWMLRKLAMTICNVELQVRLFPDSFTHGSSEHANALGFKGPKSEISINVILLSKTMNICS